MLAIAVQNMAVENPRPIYGDKALQLRGSGRDGSLTRLYRCAQRVAPQVSGDGRESDIAAAGNKRVVLLARSAPFVAE